MFRWSHLSEEEYLEKRLREAGVSNEIIAELKTELLRKADRKVIYFLCIMDTQVNVVSTYHRVRYSDVGDLLHAKTK